MYISKTDRFETNKNNEKSFSCEEIPDINDSAGVMDRLNKLVLDFERSKACKQAYDRLNSHYYRIKAYLPEEMRLELINKIDDCFIEILVLYENHFYREGYNDGKRCGGSLKEKVEKQCKRNIWTQRIQRLKMELEREIESKGLNSEMALEISRKLDSLVMEYYQEI